MSLGMGGDTYTTAVLARALSSHAGCPVHSHQRQLLSVSLYK